MGAVPKVFRAILLLSETKRGKLEFTRMENSMRKILFMEIIVQSLTARRTCPHIHPH